MTPPISEESKVDAKHYTETLLPRFIEECKSLLLYCFILRPDDVPAQTAKFAQDWIATKCSKFTDKDEWLPNLPDVNIFIIMSGEICLNTTRHFNDFIQSH